MLETPGEQTKFSLSDTNIRQDKMVMERFVLALDLFPIGTPNRIEDRLSVGRGDNSFFLRIFLGFIIIL